MVEVTQGGRGYPDLLLNFKLKLELVEVGVELGNMQITFLKFDDSTFTNSSNLQMNLSTKKY